MIRGPFGNLPMRLQKPDGINRVEACIIHPVMRLTQPRKIVRRVVRGIVVEVGDGQTGFDLQSTYGAAFERAMLVQHATRCSLISGFWCGGFCHVSFLQKSSTRTTRGMRMRTCPIYPKTG